MQTQFLVVLIPVLLVMTILIGYTSYRGLRKTIISGFDKKLRAVSSVTASFVDGDQHHRLTSLRQVRGLAFDPVTETLYGSHFAGRELLALNVRSGRCRLTAVEGLGAIENITYDGDLRILWAVESDQWRLIQIDPLKGQALAIGEIGEPCYALAYDAQHKTLYGYGERLLTFDRRNGEKRVVGRVGPNTIRGMTYLGRQEVMLGVDVHTNRLMHIDPASGEIQLSRFIIDGSDGKTARRESRDHYRFAVFGLTYNPIRDECYGSTPVGLITIGPSTGVAGSLSHPLTDNEALQIIYQHYVDPMIKIREGCNLTFLFTGILEPRERHLSYVIDSTQDESHSFVGFVDPSPSERGIEDVWFKGDVFLSGIRHWEEWGLLKSAYAPIVDSRGTVTGIAGADVNISIITQKTSKALFIVFFIGFLFLVFGGVVSVFISRRLILPMQTLAHGLLKGAAGSFGHQVEIKNPRELRFLAERFNDTSKSLSETLARHLREGEAFESRRRRRGLMSLMARRVAGNAQSAEGKLVCRWFPQIENADPSGCALKGDWGVIYVAKKQGSDHYSNIRLRHDLHLAYLKMLDRYGSDPGRLMKVLGESFLNQVSLLGLCDLSSSRLMVQCRCEWGVLFANAVGELMWKRLAEEDGIALPCGESIILSSHDAALKPLDGYRIATDHQNMLSPDKIAETVYERAGNGGEMFIVTMGNV